MVNICFTVPEYTDLGGDEELPLGEEFQSLVRCFIIQSEKKIIKKYEWTAKLIEQLQ
jgi:inositol 1,4,5-triphosphate receptor type 1